jgi:RinA family phage transcriptional activator
MVGKDESAEQRGVVGIKRQIKVYIEAELRDYHQTKREYEEMRDNLLNASAKPPDGMPKGTATGDSTYQRTERLMTNRRLKYMEKVITGIENVLGELPPEKYQLVELKYWAKPQTLTDAGIAQKIGCDRTTLWRWADGICLAIGIELGIIDEVRENLQQRCNI